MTTRFSSLKIKNIKALMSRVMLFPISLLILSQAHAVCYVNGAATGKNDGSSWTDAYTNPQFALLDKTCFEIWVAKGVYKPTLGTDRKISFVIEPGGINLYGGFAGDETTRDQRVPAVNVTVLSGDIDNDDANAGSSGVDATPADIHGNNSYNVVRIDGASSAGPITGSTVLDGFTITGGDANDLKVAYQGGGLYCDGRNTSHATGTFECSPTLRSLVFSGNTALANGGGIYDGGYSGISNPVLIDVTFTGNTASNAGGAMYNDGSATGISSPSLTNVLFSANSAAFGGAMYDFATDSVGISSPVLSSVAFIGNTATTGGAMYNEAQGGGISSPRLSVVTFSGNSTPDVEKAGVNLGGAMYNDAEGDGSVTIPILVNTTFSGNSASVGGAMYDNSSTGATVEPELTNVTFSGNSAALLGGAIYADGVGTTSASLINVILWGDTGVGGAHSEIGFDSATFSITRSILQDGCPDDTKFICTNILTGDPKLGPLAENGGFTRTLLPGFGSSAIDTGLDASCPNIDQRGVTRPQGPHCEIGAVEVIPTPPPVAEPESVVTPENTSKDISFAATDSNPGGPFSFTYGTPTTPSHGTLGKITANVVPYTPDANYTGPDSFTYTATDINGTSAPATVTIEVIPTPPPVAEPESVVTPENTSKDISFAATDSNPGGPFSFIYGTPTTPSHGTLGKITGNVVPYTPDANYTGPDSFTYTATDINGTSAPAIVTIQVVAAPPVALPRAIVVPYNTSKSVKFGATDSNLGGPFAYTFATASVPTHGTLGLVEGDTILYTPTHNYSGPDAFTYTVTDVNGISVPATVTITVLPPGGGGTPGTTTAIPTLNVWGLFALTGLIGLTCVWRKHDA